MAQALPSSHIPPGSLIPPGDNPPSSNLANTPPQHPLLPSRAFRPPLAFWCIVALVTALGVFVLPFAAPQRTPTFSNSYPYGFNNRIAELAAVFVSTAVLVFLWARKLGPNPPQPATANSVPRFWLISLSLLVAIVTAVLGAAMIHADVFYSDASHLLLQLGRVLDQHRALYRQVELPYGPLFFYIPAAFLKLFALFGVSHAAAYFVALAVTQIAGLCMLFFVLHWLPLTRALRTLTLCLFTFATLTPLLGINYTLFRFLLPHTLFLAFAASRRSSATQALIAFLGGLLCVSYSPEIGLAFICGTGCYALYRAVHEGPTWISVGAAPLLAAAVFALIVNRDYLSTTGTFAAGAFNIIVAPDFHIVVLLLAAVALSPWVVAGYLRARNSRAAAMLGFFIVSLGMLGPALGRCDALHTFFGGLGLYLLSLVAVSGRTTWPARLWVLALTLAIAASQIEDIWIYRGLLVRTLILGPDPDDGVDLAQLHTLAASQRIAAPFMIPQRVEEDLNRRAQLQPSYYVYMGGVWNDAAERRKIEEMRQAPLALIPSSDYLTVHDSHDMSRKMPLLHTHIPYRQRFAPWVQGALIDQELQLHWTPLGSVGDYTVYRQNPH